jgi:2-amino-4-hydroxy-6-hydroxymethyldihydropteridine diphosphokinase
MEKVVLGLGSNLGDRVLNLRLAINNIIESKLLKNITISSIYNTRALLKEAAPKEWDIDFLNMAIIGDCNLNPYQLLEKTTSIEKDLGKKKLGEWAPRVIDIDIIAFGYQVIADKNLNLFIPHSRMLERDWVLCQFMELWPQWKYPVKGRFYNKTIKEILNYYEK